MTSMTRKPPADADQVTKLADKLMESEELSAVMKLLADTTDDDGDGQQVGLDGDTTVKALIQASLNKALAAEMDSHLGYHHGDRSAKTGTNHRNGSYLPGPSRREHPPRPGRQLHPADGAQGLPSTRRAG